MWIWCKSSCFVMFKLYWLSQIPRKTFVIITCLSIHNKSNKNHMIHCKRAYFQNQSSTLAITVWQNVCKLLLVSRSRTSRHHYIPFITLISGQLPSMSCPSVELSPVILWNDLACWQAIDYWQVREKAFVFKKTEEPAKTSTRIVMFETLYL